MTAKVVKGSIWNLAGQVIPVAVSFISIPFVIRLLGSEGYGVLLLIVLIPTYFAFSDLGMGVASTKFESEAYARGDREGEANVVWTALLIALATAILIAVPMAVFSRSIIEYLHVPDVWQSAATYGLRAVAITLVIGVLAAVLNSPMTARLRMDLNSISTALPKVLYSAGAPVALLLGFGLNGVFTWLIFASVLGVMAVVVISGRLLPELFRPRFDSSLLRPLLRFGGGWVPAVLAVMLLANAEKLLLARMVSVRSLAYYSIAFTFANVATFLPQAITQTLIPAFAALRGTDRVEEFGALYKRNLRLTMLLPLPVLMLMAVVARPFFDIWAGPEFGVNSPLPLYILLVGVLFAVVAAVPDSLITSAGRTGLLARLYWSELIVYLPLAVVLIGRFGIAGAAVAWSFRTIVGTVLLAVMSRRISTVRFPFGAVAARAGLAALFLVPGLAFALLYDNYSPWLLLILPLSVAGYGWLLWNMSIEEDEKVWLRRRIRRIRA